MTGTVNLNGTVNFNADQNFPGTFNFITGTLGGTAEFLVPGRLNWTGGVMPGTGKTRIGPTGIANISNNNNLSLQRTFENAGVINFVATPSNIPFSNGTLNNLATGTVNLLAATTLTTSAGSSINNSGTWNVELASTTANAMTSVPFTNSGTVNLNLGTFTLSGASTNSGAINIYPSGNLTVNAAFTNSGVINFVNGTKTFTNAAAPFTNAASGQINILGGLLNWQASSMVQNAGKINVAAGAALSATNLITGAGSSINGPGAIALSFGTIAGELKSTGAMTIDSVTFNADQNLVGIVTVKGGLLGSGNVAVANDFIWQPSGGGLGLLGSGKLTLQGASVFIGTASEKVIGKVVENSGVLNWNFDVPYTFNNGVINNLAAGTINASIRTLKNS